MKYLPNVQKTDNFYFFFHTEKKESIIAVMLKKKKKRIHNCCKIETRKNYPLFLAVSDKICPR